jgi:hypothetical protein
VSHFNNPLLAVAPPGRLGTLVVYDHQTPQIILAKLLGHEPPPLAKGPPKPISWKRVAAEIDVRERTFEFWMRHARAVREAEAKEAAEAAA